MSTDSKLRALVPSISLGILGAAVSFAMWQFPPSTAEPSFINCFNYLTPTETNLFYSAGVILSVALVILSVLLRKSSIVIVEGLGLLFIGYLAAVWMRAEPISGNRLEIGPPMAIVAFAGLFLIVLVRFQLKEIAQKGILK